MTSEVADKRTALEIEAERLVRAANEYDPDAVCTLYVRRQDIYIGAQAIAAVRAWNDGSFDPAVMRDLGDRIEAAEIVVD